MTPKAGTWVLLLAALLPASTAWAQDADFPDVEQPGVKAQVSVVASRLPEADPGVTVRVLTREEIARIPARSVVDVLRCLPGLDVRRRGVDGIQADVGIRGADHNGTLFLVDGEPVNDPQTNHLSADLDVPLDAVERIEVLAGAASSLYGAGAVGGVVNIVTRGARLGRARGQVEAHYGHGSNSLDAGSVRAAARLTDALSVSADAGRSESSGFRDDTEFQSEVVRLSGTLETERGPLNASLGWARRAYGAYAFYGSAFPNQQETTITRTGRVSSELALGGWTFTPSLFVREHHDDFVLDRERPRFYENLHDTTSGAARLFGRRALWGGSLAIGVEAGRETISSTNLGSHGRSHEAVFLELARRLDTSRAEDAPGAAGFRVGLRADRYDDFGSRLSPQLAVHVVAARGIRLRASAGTAFRVPTFLDLYYSDPQNRGNPNLAPEKATNVEVGANLDLGVATLDTALFFRRGVDLIDYVRTSSTELYQARNIRRVDTRGIETTLELKPGLLKPLSRLALQSTYVSTDLRDLTLAADGVLQGKYVLDPLHVKWDLIAGSTLPFSVDASSRLSYLSRPSFADGVWLWEARLSRQLFAGDGDILELYVEGENLGGVSYEERPGVPLPGRTLFAGFHLTW